jgi:hypothetical protein
MEGLVREPVAKHTVIDFVLWVAILPIRNTDEKPELEVTSHYLQRLCNLAG